MIYPKIQTLFQRDPENFKVIEGKFKDDSYSLINNWEWTEKIDGTNIRIVAEKISYPIKSLYQFISDEKENGAYCGIYYGGRTDNAQLPKGIIEYLNNNIDINKWFDTLHLNNITKMVLFGEGYGPKIQCGHRYSDIQKFIVFDVNINNFWLNRNGVENICSRFNLDVVPLYDFENDEIGIAPLTQAIDVVKNGFKSKLGDGSANAEGLIGRTKYPLFDKHGKRLICKLKTRDFFYDREI